MLSWKTVFPAISLFPTQTREHCKAKGGVGRKNCSLGSGVSRGSAPRLTLLPWLQFFLPTPTFALQCYRLISTIQLQGSGSVGKLPPAMRDSETVLKLTLCWIVLMSLLRQMFSLSVSGLGLDMTILWGWPCVVASWCRAIWSWLTLCLICSGTHNSEGKAAGHLSLLQSFWSATDLRLL